MATDTAKIAAQEVEHSELVDMKRTKKDKKDGGAVCSSPMNGEDYPYGLALSLDDAELSKLGMKKLPEVGDEVKIVARAKVTSVNQSASENGGDSRSVRYQITRIKIG